MTRADRPTAPTLDVAVHPPAPDYAELFRRLPTAYLLVDTDLVVVDASDAYLQVVGRRRGDLVGRYLFDAFPPSQATLDADGRNTVELAFLRVRDTGLPEELPGFRYDVRDPRTGLVHRRFWSVVCTAVAGDDGDTRFILQRVLDLGGQPNDRTSTHSAVELADVALRLAHARDPQSLLGVLVEHGLAVVEAGACAVAVVAGGELEVHDGTVGTVSGRVGQLLPLAGVAGSGRRVLLPDDVDLAAVTGCRAWAVVPLLYDGASTGALALGWEAAQTFGAAQLGLVESIAAQYAQALVRVRTREAERSAAADAVGMSEALQRSLLAEPRQPAELKVVARYRPAAERVQVGGDWYDSFRTADGTTHLVVGDVSGHDREAAAAMGQVRNLLRGIAYALDGSPARVLTQLDRALVDLEVGTLATAVLVGLEQPAAETGRGLHTVHWSNAGHPPPLLLHPDGCAHLLRTEPELLLGYDATRTRTDHRIPLPPGASLLLFTDGLVERRDTDVDEGLEWLTRTVTAMTDRPLAQVCDDLLELVAGHTDDDIVLLGVHAAPVEGGHRVREELLDAVPASAARARRVVVETCRTVGVAEPYVDAAELVVGEAVANAVLHGAGPVRFRIVVSAAHLCVEAGDDAAGRPRSRPHDLESAGGRGLPIIDAVADRWGVRDDTARGLAGKTVWACLDLV